MVLHLAGYRATEDSASCANWIVETLFVFGYFGRVNYDDLRHEGCLSRKGRVERGGRKGGCFVAHRGSHRDSLSERQAV